RHTEQAEVHHQLDRASGRDRRRLDRRRRRISDDHLLVGGRHYWATKPSSFIRPLLSASSSSRNFSMSLPVRKIGFSACFSMYSSDSALCVSFWKRST